MKKLILVFLGVLAMSCSSVEEKIKDYSYTDEWHYVNTERYQVYKTKAGRKYIIVLNNRQTNFKRKYIN